MNDETSLSVHGSLPVQNRTSPQVRTSYDAPIRSATGNESLMWKWVRRLQLSAGLVDRRRAHGGTASGQSVGKGCQGAQQVRAAPQTPGESVRRQRRSHLCATRGPHGLSATRFRTCLAGMVDEQRERRRQVVVCCCLDPGRQDGQTESPGTDRYF